jgi:hypothetical protein
MTRKINLNFRWFAQVTPALIALGITGCAHSIHQYYAGDPLPPSKATKPGRVVKADSQQFVFLSFAFNTDYADEAYRQLLSQCSKGDLAGITARYSTSMHFLSYTNKMKLEGLCYE